MPALRSRGDTDSDRFSFVDSDKCGQKIDRNSRRIIEHHTTPKNLPFMGAKKRSGWGR